MDLSKQQRIRLEPRDEFTHPIEAAKNFNESMYINLFDPAAKAGGWFRVGNRPNERYAEVSCCVYFPDGRVGFMFQRPTISNNDALDAGGMRFIKKELSEVERIGGKYKIPGFEKITHKKLQELIDTMYDE